MAKARKLHPTVTAPEAGDLQWKVHTPALLQEIVSHSGQTILEKPIQILGGLLHEVGERASQLNDPILNALMCRLTIYEIADPKSSSYDPEKAAEVYRLAREEKANGSTV